MFNSFARQTTTFALTVFLILTAVTVFGQPAKTGVYQGYNKKDTVLLFLFKDSTYKQQWNGSNFSFVTFGKWKIRTDTITLSPIAVNKEENKSENEETMKNYNKIAIRKDTLDLLIYKNNIYKVFLPLTNNVTVFGKTSFDTINKTDTNGLKQGLWITHDTLLEEVRTSQLYYLDGKLHGTGKLYNSKNQLLVSMQHTNGLKNGDYIIYNVDFSKPQEIHSFQNDTLRHVQRIDPYGKVWDEDFWNEQGQHIKKPKR